MTLALPRLLELLLVLKPISSNSTANGGSRHCRKQSRALKTFRLVKDSSRTSASSKIYAEWNSSWRCRLAFISSESNILELPRVALRQWRGALCLPLRAHSISCANLKCNFRQSFSPPAFDCNPVWRFGLARCISRILLFDGNFAGRIIFESKWCGP